MPAAQSADDGIFDLRLARSAPDLFPMLETLYGTHRDYPAVRDKLVKALRKGWADRPADLKTPRPLARPRTRLVPAPRHGGLASSTSTASTARCKACWRNSTTCKTSASPTST